MSAFSIRERVCGHRGVSDDALDNDHDPNGVGGYVGLAAFYHQIDFMDYLIGDMKLWRFYGDLDRLLAHLIVKFTPAPGTSYPPSFPTHLEPVIGPLLAGVLIDLQAMVAPLGRINASLANEVIPRELIGCIPPGTKKLEHRIFFEKRFLDSSDNPMGDTGEIAQLWIDIACKLGSYACMPWVPVQQSSREKPVSYLNMSEHISRIGQNTLRDFYDEPASNQYLVEAIEFGRDKKILSRPYQLICLPIVPPGGDADAGADDFALREQATGGGNNRCCLANTSCGYFAGRFCSLTPEGVCSASSQSCAY
jgi:hypothetical protein